MATPERVCKQLDSSKTAFLTQQQTVDVKQQLDKAPGQLDKTKISQFSSNDPSTVSDQKSNVIVIIFTVIIQQGQTSTAGNKYPLNHFNRF